MTRLKPVSTIAVPPKLVPFAWKDRSALIEVAFPAQKVSIEAQTERKANAGQTLTALGSYWKGRKPLVLVRACILGSLLPATDDPEKDLEIFELLMAMDDAAFEHRVKNVSAADVEKWGGPLEKELLNSNGGWRVAGEQRRRLQGRVLRRMPYLERLNKRSLRPEELPAEAYEHIWAPVNAHFGTSARSHAELVEQIGILRFGRRPRVADTFCGGGSIPFEAARLGCDSYASDLNPIACMLTWGAFNIVGADAATRERYARTHEQVVAAVDREITRLGVEHDGTGNRAKAYLYCVEVRCPETGWMVPLLPSLVISKNKKCVAKLVADRKEKRFRIEIRWRASVGEIAEAEASGTVRDGDLVYTIDKKDHRTPIRTLRGDRTVDGRTVNELRRWEKKDVVPRPGDIFQERLYCVQWMNGDDARDCTYRTVTEDDLAREEKVVGFVRKKLAAWQEEGLVPNMAIQPGAKTDEPIRTRGWTYWHHLFTPRSLLINALYKQSVRGVADPQAQGALAFTLNTLADRSARLSRWEVGFPGRQGVAPSADAVKSTFYNMALNTLYLYGTRSFGHLGPSLSFSEYAAAQLPGVSLSASTLPACDVAAEAELFVTDPPYADAIRYEEITEYFIAWQRQSPAPPFADWVWDSRRDIAIKGAGESFRREMVKAYSAMAVHMSDDGLQIVMFTHQDTGVWADMAGIFWGAGLKVTAAWYIATEVNAGFKKGGYVQGTMILVLRKRLGTEKTYKDELVLEIRQEVARQIETMIGLNQRTRSSGRSENLFEDADLQMAGFAAALRVITSYTHIDGRDMTREAARPRTEGDPSLVDELIEFAVATANEHLVPEGLPAKVWERLVGSERFYLRMLDIEAAGIKKLDNFQNFAKAFRVADWKPMMATAKAAESRLKSAAELKRAEFAGSEFAASLLRALLFALYELEREVEPGEALGHLRDNVADYHKRRQDIVAIAEYVAHVLDKRRPDEAAAARILAGLVRNEKVS
jgi:putative DNA methylase